MDLDKLKVPRNHKVYPMKQYQGQPLTCPACNFHTPSFQQYAWNWHISQVRAAIESLTPSGMTLIGKAVSPTGRASATAFVHNIWTPEPLPYAVPPWLGEYLRANKRGPQIILNAIDKHRPWNLITGSDSVFYGWAMGVNRTGKDTGSVHDTEMGAMVSGLNALAKLETKNWDITLSVDFVDKEVTSKVIGPKKDSITVLSDLITKSRNAKDTKTRIRRMKEIDAMLDQMEVLKGVRAELHNRLLLG